MASASASNAAVEPHGRRASIPPTQREAAQQCASVARASSSGSSFSVTCGSGMVASVLTSPEAQPRHATVGKDVQPHVRDGPEVRERQKMSRIRAELGLPQQRPPGSADNSSWQQRKQRTSLAGTPTCNGCWRTFVATFWTARRRTGSRSWKASSMTARRGIRTAYAPWWPERSRPATPETRTRPCYFSPVPGAAAGGETSAVWVGSLSRLRTAFRCHRGDPRRLVDRRHCSHPGAGRRCTCAIGNVGP